MGQAMTLKELFLQSYAAIPATVTREHIAASVNAYLASYAHNDLAERAQLFASEITAEEPVGGVLIEGIEALKAFWKASVDAGWQCRNDLVRLVINGNEAFVAFRSHLSLDGQGAVVLDVFETLRFDDDGLIRQLRAFNDATCLS